VNLQERLARLDRAVERNEVRRGQWRACLLSQLSPECEQEESASYCPSEVMPEWLASLTPWIDDSGTIEHWPEVVRRYASLAHRWHKLTPEQWTRLDYRVRAICVREAMRHTTSEAVLSVCDTVTALCDRAASGDMPSGEEWAAAARAAAAAWAAAARAAAAAWAAAWTAARAARAAAEAARAAAWAAWAAAAEAARAVEAAEAAEATPFILSVALEVAAELNITWEE